MNIEHLTTFDQCGEGATQYGGTMNIAAIKRRFKSAEIKVLLVPYKDLPPAMAALMDPNLTNPDSLIMFAAPNPTAPPPRKKAMTTKVTE